MSRIYSYKEIRDGLIPTPDQIAQLVVEIQELPEFKIGNVVVFGSAALGAQSWRSDIDVAYYNPPMVDWFKLGRDYEFVDREGIRRKIYPIICAILGLSPKDPKDGLYRCSDMLNLVSLNESPEEGGVGEYGVPAAKPRFFSPTLHDHFKFLAEHKGGTYREFYQMLPWKTGTTRSHEIRSYMAYYLSVAPYDQDLLIALEGESEEDRTLITAGRQESFPIHLIRKILGQKRCYPELDVRPELLSRFTALPYPWVGVLLELFQGFWKFEELYVEMVEQVRQGQLAAVDYRRFISEYFEKQPWVDIYKVVQSAYPSIIKYHPWDEYTLEDLKANFDLSMRYFL